MNKLHQFTMSAHEFLRCGTTSPTAYFFPTSRPSPCTGGTMMQAAASAEKQIPMADTAHEHLMPKRTSTSEHRKKRRSQTQASDLLA